MRAANRESGFGTVELIVALSLLAVVLVSVMGTQMLVLSAGAAAEASSMATNLARARMEELLALSPAQILAQDGTETLQQVPPGQGRVFTVHTAVDAADPAYLDITVTVRWQVTYGSACTSGPGASGAACTGSTATYTRTLQTRVERS